MSFSTTPGDVQRYIASLSTPLSNRNLLLASRRVRTNLEEEYLKRICGFPISQQEFIRYLASSPLKIGNVAITPISAEGYLRTRVGDNYRTNLRCIKQQTNVSCFNTNDIQPVERVHRVFTNRGYSDQDYDLLTTGNILLRRLNCIRVNPLYVRNHLLSLLEKMKVVTPRNRLLIILNAEIFGVPWNLESIREAINRLF